MSFKTLKSLMCLFIFFISYDLVNAQVKADVTDSLALVDLYNSSNGELWRNTQNWLNAPVRNWEGVGLGAGGKVVSLRLSEFNLNGTLPESIGNLTELTELDIRENNLTGVIPNTIGNLTKLSKQKGKVQI